jgi:hypothetical protein
LSIFGVLSIAWDRFSKLDNYCYNPGLNVTCYFGLCISARLFISKLQGTPIDPAKISEETFLNL